MSNHRVLEGGSGQGEKNSRPASSVADKHNLSPFSCTNFHPIHYLCKVWGLIKILFFIPCVYQSTLSPFVEKATFPPLNWFCTFVKNQLVIQVRVCFKVFYWILLVCRSNPPLRPHCLDYCRYIADLNIGWSNSSHSLFFQACFSYSRACAFPNKF